LSSLDDSTTQQGAAGSTHSAAADPAKEFGVGRYERPLLRSHGDLRDLTAQKSGDYKLTDNSDVNVKENHVAVVWT